MASVLIEKVGHMNRQEKPLNSLVNVLATKVAASFRWIGEGQPTETRK
jgi:hypothetical protein